MNILKAIAILSILAVPRICCALELTASIHPVHILLKELASGVPDTSCALLLPSSTGCPHDYSMTPRDRKNLAKTDVLVVNGLGLEAFLGTPGDTAQLMKPNAVIIDCSKGVEGVLPATENDRTPSAGLHPANPHIFASPVMLERMACSLARSLAELDPAHAEAYGNNLAELKKNLAPCIEKLAALNKKACGKNLIPQHGIFDYLARDAGFSVPAHVSHGEEAATSAAELATLIRNIRLTGAAAVITEPQYPGRTARTAAAEAGVPCLELDPGASGPENETLGDWVGIMMANAEKLEALLGK